MRLNPDCIRDILLSVEEVVQVDVLYTYDRDERAGTRLGQYDHDEIRYHIRQCAMSGLITGYEEWNCGNYIKIHDLDPAGHTFLANIRSQTLWTKLKSHCVQAGIDSLPAIVQSAAKLAGAQLWEHITSGG